MPIQKSRRDLDKDEQDEHRLQVLVGEYQAGNNSELLFVS